MDQLEQKRQYERDYYARNKERFKKKRREQYLKHRDSELKRSAEYRQTYYASHREEILAKAKAKRSIIREQIRERLRNDPQFKLSLRLRYRIWKALKQQSATKSKRTLALIGCSIETLKNHLESQFLPGMTWDNYGTWHVDHILPCAFFDLSNVEEQEKCFHFSNLQPLWASDNISKGSKVPSNLDLTLKERS